MTEIGHRLRRAQQDLSWMDDAACRDKPTRIFFPERGETQEPAQEICAACPVFDRCHDYALTLPPNEPGIYAGMSQRERRRIRWPANR